MPALVKLSSKGQLVIPKDIRQKLGLKPGDRLHVHVDEQGIRLEPVSKTAIDELFGAFVATDLIAELEAEHQQEVEIDKAIRA
jgi:AbrB family looped-hinge helix DNA binding protein